MKCWNSAFNAQGSRGILLATGRSSENICSTSEGTQEKRKREWNSGNHQNVFPEFHPVFLSNVLYGRVFLNVTLFMTKLRVRVVSFPDFTDNSIILIRRKEPPIWVISKPQRTDGFHESTCQQQFEGYKDGHFNFSPLFKHHGYIRNGFFGF
jgi:hypothetical protein